MSVLARSLTAGLLALALVACGPSGSGDAPSPAPVVSDDEPALPADAAARLAALPAPYDHADLDNGALHFHLCQSCHTATQGGPDMTGPNLYGVFGRRVASKPGFAYSDALKARDWTWDIPHLDAWLTNPRALVPGTKMSFYGLRDDKDRLDTIAYLKIVSSTPAP